MESPYPYQPGESPAEEIPRERREKSSRTVVVILVVLFLLSGLLNIVLFLAVVGMSVGSAAAGGLEKVLVEGPADAKEEVLLVRVEGVIVREGGFSGRTDARTYVKKRLDVVRKDPSRYKGVILLVNSPGGGVTESDEIYHEIRAFKKETGLPVVAYFRNVAASGGYYIAAACDRIVAHRTCITGSIGVIMTFLQAEELMKKVGVKANVILPERTPYKDIGSPFREMKEAERAILRKLVEEIYDRFVDVVAAGRKDLSRTDVLRLATGVIYSAADALRNKLVDRIGYFSDAVEEVRSLSGAGKVKVVELRERPGMIASLLGIAEHRRPLMWTPLEKIREVYNGQPMYLWVPGGMGEERP